MNVYDHKLTEIEIACGVTLEQVARELPRVLIRDHGKTVHIDGSLPPALAGSVARCALGTDKYAFKGIGKNTGFLIYSTEGN